MYISCNCNKVWYIKGASTAISEWGGVCEYMWKHCEGEGCEIDLAIQCNYAFFSPL